MGWFFSPSDNCKKLGLVFENAVGIVEVINSKAVQLQVSKTKRWWLCLYRTVSCCFINPPIVRFLQVLGTVPTISINKTEGCQIYLSKDALSCDIVSAKSSEMNILIPEGDDDYVSVRTKMSWKHRVVCLFWFLFVMLNISDHLSLFLQREFPVPEQFKTVWDGSKLVTEPTEIAGWLNANTDSTVQNEWKSSKNKK